MLEKTIRGFTVIAHEFVAKDALTWILGARRIGPGSYEYLIAGMRNFDNDDFWVTSGYYPASIKVATDIYKSKVA